MKRRIAQLVAPKEFEIIEEEISVLGNNEILMEVIATGICHSEMPAYNGIRHWKMIENQLPSVDKNLQYPLRLGHEPVGKIVEVGKDIKDFKIGDYIGGPIKSSFSSHLIVNALRDRIVKIPKTDKPIKYCLPEPLMCISNIVRAASPGFGDCIAVVGCGMMGLLSIATLRESGARELIGIDLLDERLELAKEFGATTTFNPKKVNIIKEIQKLTNGTGVEIAIEISGTLKGLKTATDVILNKGRGKILLPTLYAFNEAWDPVLGYQLMFKSPILHSTHPFYSRDYMEDIKRGVWGYVTGKMPLDKLITHEFKLENIKKGFEIAASGADNYIKGIIIP